MSADWLVLAFGLLGLVAAVVVRSRRARHSDLGFVSQRWLAEHRLSYEQHAQR